MFKKCILWLLCCAVLLSLAVAEDANLEPELVPLDTTLISAY